MPRTKRQPDPTPEPRTLLIRFRVDAAEHETVAARARTAGVTISDFQRLLNQLPALHKTASKGGAPLGNRNKTGKPGRNQHTGRKGRPGEAR